MKKYKVGYTTGVFDMFHVGHLNILKRAKEQCDYLIVGVSTDELVEHDKHKTPIIPFADRARIVQAVRYVDQVVPQPNKDKFAAWKALHFDVMFVGSDWQGSPQWVEFERQFAPVGVDIVYLPHTDGISSTLLRDKIAPPRNREIIGYTQGTFDLFHIGHLNLLEHAKEQCDYLIVGVNSDALVEDYKHKHPVVGELERAEVLSGMSVVDECHIVTTLDKMDAYAKFHFDRIFIGDDWRGNSRWEQTKTEMDSIGVQLVFLPHTSGISTTAITESINNI